jgi:ABC-type lipoprotein release transport system permease subunit
VAAALGASFNAWVGAVLYRVRCGLRSRWRASAGLAIIVAYLVAAVLGVLMLLSLAHHLILSTHRRGRDLAVLRALGADRRWVTGVVHWQASLFTIVVVALGAPIGIAAGRVVYRNFVDRVGAVDTVTLPVAFFALAFVVLVALANVVAAPSAHRARQRPPARALADE